MFYIFIQDNKINGAGQCRQLTEGVLNIEVEEEIYNSFIENPNRYIYQEDEIVLNPNYEQEQAQKERERLNLLFLTSADVERALYKSKGIDFTDIIELVKNNSEIDIKALKIELKANNFYRGNPYVSTIGDLLGISSEDLDYLFENKEFPTQIQEGGEDEMVL